MVEPRGMTPEEIAELQRRPIVSIVPPFAPRFPITVTEIPTTWERRELTREELQELGDSTVTPDEEQKS